MRIVYTVLHGRIAGGQMICLRILQAARRRGDEVCLVSPSRGELTEVLERDGVPVFIVPLDRTFQLHGAWRLARLLRTRQADLVHCHAFIPGAILARIAGGLAGVPVICHLHAFPTFSQNPAIRMLQVALERFTARFARFVAVSEAVRDAYVRHGIPAERVTVIENGVAPSREPDGEVQALRLRSGQVNDARILVGYAGRLSAQKGLDDLIQAAAELKRRGLGVRVVLAGEEHDGNGSYPTALRKLIAENDLERDVTLLGFVPDVAAFMRSLDVFVLPSHLEAVPVSVLEAMAAARPVVATAVGGVPELVVDGETGTLVPPCDPSRLADAIGELAADPELRARFGRNARARVVQRFSEQRMLDAVWQCYAETL
jgi:glycosyltransferase involved in cell wall biosynthesis